MASLETRQNPASIVVANEINIFSDAVLSTFFTFGSMDEAMEHFRHQYRISTAEQEAIVWDHLGWVLKVENALMSHPAVMEGAVTGAADPLRGQVAKATVVLTGEYQPSDDLKLELQDHVKKVTAPPTSTRGSSSSWRPSQRPSAAR
jgi:acyl-CoA synthetase (AMP-forming)/AMP-acid ligase II